VIGKGTGNLAATGRVPTGHAGTVKKKESNFEEKKVSFKKCNIFNVI